MYDWRYAHPEFDSALCDAIDFSLAYWEDMACEGIHNPKGFNGQLWSRIMAARFHNDYRVEKKIDHTNSDGTLARMSDEQVNAQLEAIHKAALEKMRAELEDAASKFV